MDGLDGVELGWKGGKGLGKREKMMGMAGVGRPMKGEG